MKPPQGTRSAAFERELEAAADAQRRGDLAQAIARYRRLIERRPELAAAHANLAAALRRAGDLPGAMQAFACALRLDGGRPEVWFNYANLLRDAGRAAEAEDAYRRALAIEPGFHRAATNLANLLAALGRTGEALALHRAALATAPDNLPSLRALGRLLFERGELAEAERCYRRAHELAPAHADTLNALGVVLRALGREKEAIECWNRVLRAHPGYSAAHNNLGVLYRLRREPQRAVEHLRAAVRLDPRDATTAANLAHALIDLGQISEAAHVARGIIERAPDSAEGHLMLGFARVYQGEVEEGLAQFMEAHRCAPQSALVISDALFASLYSAERDAAVVFELHRELAARIAPAQPVRTAWRNTRDPARRLKVGYLSPDFRSHPVAAFFEPVLAHHDAGQVEAHCYSTTHAPDAVTERLRGMAHEWRDCKAMSDAQLAAQIEADGIDILVDLAGHTAQNRAAVLRAKPAPVQVLYIGYPGTSGLPEVDWMIADARVCPPGMERYHTERIARVEGSFWCYRAPANAPEPAAPPALKRGYVTFGSYNALQKMSDAVVALWKRVLQAVPGSHLALKSLAFADAHTREAVRRRFTDAGIAAECIEVLPPSDGAQFLAEYRRMDIALDPFPYNGGTTTCEALWMGVPVVALEGERFCARMGASMLRSIGLPELVARDAEDYVRIADGLANDTARLAALRGELRARMAASPLCDAPRAARELEQVYRAMWRDWIARSG